MKMKKIGALFLALTMLCSLLSVPAQATAAECPDSVGLQNPPEPDSSSRLSEVSLLPVQTTSPPLTITYDSADNVAPNKPTLQSKTDTSVTLEPIPGAEYSTDRVNWQSDNTFTGLTPYTTYTFYARMAATEIHGASPASLAFIETTNKGTQPAPATPVLQSMTPTSVTIKPLEGAEYSKGGVIWQSENTFDGLTSYTTYYFYVRLKETPRYNASPASPVLSVVPEKGAQAAPAMPALQAKTGNSVTLQAISGAEYSKDGKTWQPGNVFEGLQPNTPYSFYARLKETDVWKASPASAVLSVTTNKGTQAVPAKPSIKSKTQNRVVLKKVSGAEYSRDGDKWQSDTTFKNLKANTVYSFYVRMKTTASYEASPKSAAIYVATNKKLKMKTQPKGKTVKRKKAATLKAKAQGGTKTLKYQWYTSKKKNSGFKKATGTTAKKASFKAPTKTKGVRYYRCIITDGAGIKVTSKTVKVTVK